MKTLLFSASALMLAATSAVAAPEPTPAEAAVSLAETQIAADPKRPDGYNELAIALARRARETSDTKYYSDGEAAVEKSLALQPENFGALKARTWLLLGKHEFAKARDIAEELNKKAPDDLQIYGFLTDANAELGDYTAAEAACNWMLRLRPGNIPALTRAAYLRELFGDLDGAQEAMTQAFQATPVTSVEDRAWILTQIAHLRLMAERPDEAEQLLAEALKLFPDYHYALANLARARIAQGRYDEAVDLFRRRFNSAPHAENLYDLAEALDLAGRGEEAAKAFAEFERKSIAESETADNSNRELVFYYADHVGRAAKALEIAEKEFTRKQDVYTRDAYAWSLHVNGRDSQAEKQIEAALSVGVVDPRLKQHAEGIRKSLRASSPM